MEIGKETAVARGWGERWMNRQSTEDYRAVKTLCYTIMVDP